MKMKRQTPGIDMKECKTPRLIMKISDKSEFEEDEEDDNYDKTKENEDKPKIPVEWNLEFLKVLHSKNLKRD
jgi:hypothetical protein